MQTRKVIPKTNANQVNTFFTSSDAHSNKTKWPAGPMKAFQKNNEFLDNENLKKNTEELTKST